MCCTPQGHHEGKRMSGIIHCCGSATSKPMHGFLSKKKKIEAYEKCLENLREEIQDIEEYIAELQKAK